MNTKTTPKDFFLHIGATVALYSAVIAFIDLAFEIINKLLPDQLNNYWNASSIVWPISMLVVLVPVLYVIEWFIARDLSKMIEKKDIWVRKWRIYLTLFLTGATIAGDLITLINTYLNGEISARFVYKVIIVFVVCSTVFKYYLFSVHESARWTKLVKKTVPWFGILIVVAVIVGGFVIVGSPSQQRAIRFDEQRVQDLVNIQGQIIRYWQYSQTLPQTISDLNDPTSDFTVTVDPETGNAYEYLIKSNPLSIKGTSNEPSFELCATFSTDSNLASDSSTNVSGAIIQPTPAGNKYGLITTTLKQPDSWVHSAGHVCFERVIDPTLYPPINPLK